MFAPAQVQHEFVTKLHGEALNALAAPDVRAPFERAGMMAAGTTPEQFMQQVRGDISRYRKIARGAGIKAE